MIREIWKDIPGYEGLYKVSNQGRIYSLRKHRCLNGGRNQAGYRLVTLIGINGERKSFQVHRLVALEFVENPDGKPEVNHKDEIKSNNMASNLEWVTRTENVRYGTRGERAGKKIAISKGVRVTQKDKSGNIVKVWQSQQEASRALGIPQGNISRCCAGKRNIVHGFKWEFTGGGEK